MYYGYIYIHAQLLPGRPPNARRGPGSLVGALQERSGSHTCPSDAKVLLDPTHGSSRRPLDALKTNRQVL